MDLLLDDSRPEIALGPKPLVDSFGRRIEYVRVSVTDRCDLRCVYCMSTDTTFLPRHELLSLREMERLCGVLMERGVRKIRFTGGEPLVRPMIVDLIERLSPYLGVGLDEITLTTNGSRLDRYVQRLAVAGVKRLNVSLDSRDPQVFRMITRGGDLDRVYTGIAAAQRAGMAVKINMVILKGINEDEVPSMIHWAHGSNMQLTLIEVMPLGDVQAARFDQHTSLADLRRNLDRQFTLTPIEQRTGGPARYFRVENTGGTLGLITPISGNFCATCNRVRVTCDGILYSCLGHAEGIDLRTPLRAAEDNALINLALDEAIFHKPKAHDFAIDRDGGKALVGRRMNVTGG